MPQKFIPYPQGWDAYHTVSGFFPLSSQSLSLHPFLTFSPSQFTFISFSLLFAHLLTCVLFGIFLSRVKGDWRRVSADDNNRDHSRVSCLKYYSVNTHSWISTAHGRVSKVNKQVKWSKTLWSEYAYWAVLANRCRERPSALLKTRPYNLGVLKNGGFLKSFLPD